MGSGNQSTAEADDVGRLVARLGAHLLTGGGQGQMAAVSRGFVRSELRSGLCIGILPSKEKGSQEPPEGYPNEYVELPIYTHLWQRGAEGAEVGSRHSINVMSSTAVVVLYGNEGTVWEARLARQWGKPVALFMAEATRQLPDADKLMAVFDEPPLSTLAELEHWLRHQFDM
jgi:uncharacterized protein (TIGR00725 family)